MSAFFLRAGLAVTSLLLACQTASANPINIVPFGTLTVPVSTDFNDVFGGGNPATNYDGILTSGSATFAERFVGQTLSFSGDFDVLSGTPTGPLTLQAGALGRNLAVAGAPDLVLGNQVYPLGSTSFLGLDAIGEGALAVLFPIDQSELGFNFAGADGGGSTIINFFRRDGSLIDTIALALIGLEGGFLAFQRDLSIPDIAGLSIHTSDPDGLSYDNFRYSGQPVGGIPEPSGLALFGIGFLGVVGYGWYRRRQASTLA